VVDLQIIFPQELAVVRSSTLVSSSPPTLRVLGQDFRAVDEVLINDVASPGVILLSSKALLARVPDSVPPSSIASIVVTSRTLTLTDSSRIKFQLGRVPSKTTGILRLMQLFLKILFTTPGTDIFSKNLGGGALRIAGAAAGRTGTNLVGDVIVAVGNTERQVIALQGRQGQVPPEERLLSAQVISSRFDPEDASLLASIQLTNQTGRPALANLVV
jgi:hypothetical protein